MYDDATISRGVKRPVKDRLGASFVRPSASALNREEFIKRQRQDIINWNNRFRGGKNHVTGNVVPKDLKTSDLQKDILKNPTNKISGAAEIQKKVLGTAGGLTNAYPDETKATAAKKLISAKKHAVQSVSAPKTAVKATPTAEKKHIVAEQLTLKAFLQNLGLSKYDIMFQAEEVDMIALKHMDDDDLKFIGLPMGPRKKILVALAHAEACN